MTIDRYPLHHQSEVDVTVDVQTLFDYLDDHRRIASHMEKPSLMMAGATMRVETDALCGQAVGSVIRMTGRVLGMKLSVQEVVTVHAPPLNKKWETRGEPTLLVIGSYRMGFTVEARGDRTHLAVFIDYCPPISGLSRLLGHIFGPTYAAWCTRRITADAITFAEMRPR